MADDEGTQSGDAPAENVPSAQPAEREADSAAEAGQDAPQQPGDPGPGIADAAEQPDEA